jgi:hypothetical protein
VAIAQGQLALRDLERHALLEEAEQHAHEAGTVGARLAVEQNGILDALEQLRRGPH